MCKQLVSRSLTKRLFFKSKKTPSSFSTTLPLTCEYEWVFPVKTRGRRRRRILFHRRLVWCWRRTADLLPVKTQRPPSSGALAACCPGKHFEGMLHFPAKKFAFINFLILKSLQRNTNFLWCVALRCLVFMTYCQLNVVSFVVSKITFFNKW